MAPWTRYQLLDSSEDQPYTATTTRWLLEWLQAVESFPGTLSERLRPLSGRIKRDYGSWKTILITAAALLLLAVLIGFVVSWTKSSGDLASEDALQYVDPLAATGLGGHVFAGASLPFGMAKPVADVQGENMAGFASDGSRVIGFSHLHDSGTGGADLTQKSPSMGNFPIFVYSSCQNDSIENCEFRKSLRGQAYVPGSVTATPGYFALDLESGVHAEMTATHHVALYRFSFTMEQNPSPVIYTDTSDLPGSYGARTIVVNPESGQMKGEGEYSPSFGEGQYKAYFCADFKGAQIREVGGFDETVFPGETNMTGVQVGVYAWFKNMEQDDQITARVGLSWLSADRACMNAEQEVPDWDFERVHNEAVDAWRTKFKAISVVPTNIDKSQLQNFWSSIYRAFLSPQDYTGENQLWNSSEPYYDSWYCIWDTFRGVHPFLTLVDPVSQSRMVRSLIDIYKHAGWLPDCRMSFCKGFTQGGSNADVVLVDAFVKGVSNVSWDDAYEAVINDAENQPSNWRVQGRGGLKSWVEVGYVPYHDDDSGGLRTRSISRTVEYAYNDFCIAVMANATGRQDDYERYAQRAGNWQNVFNEDLESMGFANFPQPRNHNGTWAFQNATLCSPINDLDGCYLSSGGHETYEGSPWLYQFYVPGDMAALIRMLGGRGSFVKRLDKLHNSGVLWIGDEQAFFTTFQYHYAGRPGLSSQRAHFYIPRLFNESIAGLPGNDDGGSMSAFVFFSMLGIYPNPGQSVYLIIPPFFSEISITNPETHKRATIRNVNFESENIYIQSARLDGKPYTRNWISHDFFASGGILELTLGKTESDWGTHEDDVPPSLSTGLFLG